MSGVVCNIFIINPHIIQELFKKLIINHIEIFYNIKLDKDHVMTPIVIRNHFMAIGNDCLQYLCSYRGILAECNYFNYTYVRTSYWKCPNNCLPAQMFKYLPTLPLKCISCDSILEELYIHRNIGHFVEGQLYLNTIRRGNDYQFINWLNFRLEDSRIRLMTLGNEYIFTGLWTNNNTLFDVWGCELIKASNRLLNNNTKIDLLRKKCEKYYGTFVKLLASKIAHGIVSPNSFMHLKIGLLLSLASTQSDFCIPILAVAENHADVQNSNNLMLSALNLSYRSTMFHYPFNKFGVNFDGATGRLIGGAITYSKNGICYIGDLTPYSNQLLESITHCLNYGFIYVDGLEGEKVRFECGIWTTLNQNQLNENTKFKSILKAFSLQWKVNPLMDPNFESNNITRYNAIMQEITIDDLKQYIATVKLIKVKLTTEGSKLLRQYLNWSNKLRKEQFSSIYYKKVIRLIESHARLHMRTYTTYYDILAIIDLCEIGLNPIRPYPRFKNPQELGKWFDNNSKLIL